MWMKNVNSFQIAKVQAQGVAKLLLVFLAFSASPIKVLLIKKTCSSATG